MEPGTNVIQLTDEQLAGFAKKCVSNYMEEMKKKREDEKDTIAKKRFKLTKALLKAYPALKAHAENSIYSEVQLYGSPYEELERMMQGTAADDTHEEYMVQSIMESSKRTATMLYHVEHELGIFKEDCCAAGRDHIFITLEDLYLSNPPMTLQDAAAELNVDESTVRNYRDQGVRSFMIYLFGVDGMNSR